MVWTFKGSIFKAVHTLLAGVACIMEARMAQWLGYWTYSAVLYVSNSTESSTEFLGKGLKP